jgi:hypothetical protein
MPGIAATERRPIRVLKWPHAPMLTDNLSLRRTSGQRPQDLIRYDVDQTAAGLNPFVLYFFCTNRSFTEICAG